MPDIRTATTADAPALAETAERLFRLGHAGEASQSDLDAYCAAHFGHALQAAELQEPWTTYFLALADWGIAGYIQLRLDRTPPTSLTIEGQRPCEVKRVYVDPEFHGLGLAGRLMETAFAAARTADSQLIWLSVWQNNLRAIAFYEKMGYRISGESRFKLGSLIQEDWIMARRLY